MGCASSTPLLESGKNFVDGAKESVSDTVSKGEQTLKDVGDAAKEGVESGLENVKEAMHAALTTAENGMENVAGKIGETFNFTSSKVTETIHDVDAQKDELMDDAADAAAEVVSEAETVLASETESAKDVLASSSTAVFESVHNLEGKVANKALEVKEDAAETLDDLEDDIEQGFGVLGDSVSHVDMKVQEELKTTPIVSPIKETKKEELPPTFWEAAADAILLRRTVKSMDFRDPETERNVHTQHEKYEENEPSHHNEAMINQFLTKDNTDHQP